MHTLLCETGCLPVCPSTVWRNTGTVGQRVAIGPGATHPLLEPSLVTLTLHPQLSPTDPEDLVGRTVFKKVEKRVGSSGL